MFPHTSQKYNTIKMMDELIRYPICLASVWEIAPFKAFFINVHRDFFQASPFSKQFLYLKASGCPRVSIVETA